MSPWAKRSEVERSQQYKTNGWDADAIDVNSIT